MAEIMDNVEFLSQHIGPRPAGTEEEQQAALYITERLQKDAQLSATIEDFNGATSSNTALVICCVITFIVTVCSLVFPVVAFAALIVTILAAIIFCLEAFDRPIISRMFSKGVSQNVVARCEPRSSADGNTRRRKIILVARYDSGKVRAELNGPLFGMLPLLRKITLGAMIVVPVLLLVRTVFFAHATGVVAIVFTVLTIIALVATLLPFVGAIMHKIAPYNDAANCNASGVAVLLDIATRVGLGKVATAQRLDRENAPVIHGENAVRAAGFVPEGVQLVYEASQMQPPDLFDQSPEARLASAKAAVAALSGRPVSQAPASDIAAHLVQVKEPPLAASTEEERRELRSATRETFASRSDNVADRASEHIEAESEISPAPSAADEQDIPAAYGEAVSQRVETSPVHGVVSVASSAPTQAVPDWFAKAQEKAKKQQDDNNTPAQRSRYADALDTALDEARAARGAATTPAHAAVSESRMSAASGGVAQHAAEYDKAAFAVSVPPGAKSAEDAHATRAMPPINVENLQAEKRHAERQRAATKNSVQKSSSSRRAISLPDIGAAASVAAPVATMQKQRAPLAEAADSGKAAAKSLLSALPSISAKGASRAEVSPSEEPKRTSSLRDKLPSLSGVVASSQEMMSKTQSAAVSEQKSEQKTSRRRSDVEGASQQAPSVNVASTFVPAGVTGTFAPVGEELVENLDPNDIFIDDVDDSAYSGQFAETNAPFEPGYVEMPQSRMHRLLDKLPRRKRKDADEITTQEWLDVDESFDAPSAGAARGGWESFRRDRGEYDDGVSEWDALGSDEEVSYNDDYFDEGVGEEGFEEYEQEERRSSRSSRRRWNGGALSRRLIERVSDLSTDGYSEKEASHSVEKNSVAEEIEQIYQFKNSGLATEVWFVALGSELADNSGMRAFLNEHAQDLRGSIIVEIEGLGAGDLALVESEGVYRRTKTSSRMKRYIRKASSATGMSVSSVDMLWQESASSYANKHGYQSLHLVGAQGGKPAFFAQGDDVIDSIDEGLLYDRADFIMELLQNI